MLKLQDIYAKREYNVLLAEEMRKIGEDKTVEDLEYCGKFSRVATCKECGAEHYGGSYYCKNRFCSICAKLRAMAWLSKLVPLLTDYRKRGYLIFFLNLTIKDQKNLSKGLDYLQGAWRFMTHEDKGSRKRFKQLNSGGVRSVEVKVGKNSGLWHPHIHSIVILKSKVNVRQYDEYKDLWERATCHTMKTQDKVGSVFISGLKAEGKEGNASLIKAIVETFKYIVKFSLEDFEIEGRLQEVVKAVRKRKFINAWGELYRLNQQVEELLATQSEEEIKGLACTVCGCTEFELETILTDTLSHEIKEFFAKPKIVSSP